MIGFPEEGLAGSVPILDSAGGLETLLYWRDEVLCTLCEEDVTSTSKWLMLKNGSSAKLVAKLERTGIV